MDVLLDSYFDNVFCKLERSYLLVRYRRRQIVDYLNTVIQGCVHDEDCDEETGVRRIVMAAIRYHFSSKTSNGKVCLMGKYHNVLYIAVKLCWDWKLSDNPTVIQLLKDIYGCEHTFERLFIGAIFGTRITHLISGWKSDFENSEENVVAIEYFLKHATQARLEYIYDDQMTRFVDIPMESYERLSPVEAAFQFLKPDVLLLLLRFGATLIMDCENVVSPVDSPLRQLKYSCVTNLSMYRTSAPLACLKILLRALPTVAILPSDSSSDGEICVLKGTEKGFGKNILCFHPRLLHEGVIPPSRAGFTPPELKHLCRCAIRNVLRDNWQLPLGIRSLQIPLSLQDYLDLLED